jgi:hypothetical protein
MPTLSRIIHHIYQSSGGRSGDVGGVGTSDERLATWDLTEWSWLASKAQLRNPGTRRLCVLHDPGNSPSRTSPAVEDQGVAEFFEETIASLQIARSAVRQRLPADVRQDLLDD